jgi:hypothetical protein
MERKFKLLLKDIEFVQLAKDWVVLMLLQFKLARDAKVEE